MATYPPPVQVQRKRGIGCGCSLLILLLLLFAGLIALAGWYLFHTVESYTAPSANAVPQFDGGDQVAADADQRLRAFEQAVQSGQPATLHLTADQINTLIARDPSFAKVRGHLFVSASGDEARIQFSEPIDSFENYVFADRFLNGDISFGLSFDTSNHSVNLDLHKIHLAGQPMPNGFEEGFNRTYNTAFNQKLQANPAVRDFFNRVQTLTIQNGELVIEVK